MKINVNSISHEGLEIEEDIKPSELNIETDQVHYGDSVKVKARLEREKGIVTAHCSVAAVEKQVCSRCLAEFELTLDKKEDFIYQLQGENQIDLSDNIKDMILLDYPIRMLCKPDCKGLCPNCGWNLNRGPCDCTK